MTLIFSPPKRRGHAFALAVTLALALSLFFSLSFPVCAEVEQEAQITLIVESNVVDWNTATTVYRLELGNKTDFDDLRGNIFTVQGWDERKGSLESYSVEWYNGEGWLSLSPSAYSYLRDHRSVKIRVRGEYEGVAVGDGYAVSIDHVPLSFGAAYRNYTWWNTSWFRSKCLNISGSAGAGEDYQILLNVGYDEEVEGVDFHLGGEVQTDFDDIRFTSSDSQTLYDYYIESVVSGLCRVYVEVRANASNDFEIMIYYKNPSAASDSDGDDTFLLFDHFLGDSLDVAKWEGETGDVLVGSSIVTVGDDVGVLSRFYSKDAFLYNVSIRTKAHFYRDIQDSAYGFRFPTGPYDGATIIYDSVGHRTQTENEGVATKNSLSLSDAYHIYDINWLSDSVGFVVDGDLKYTHDTNLPDEACRVRSAVLSSSPPLTARVDIDWVFVRKYVDPEPVFSHVCGNYSGFPPISSSVYLPHNDVGATWVRWYFPDDSNFTGCDVYVDSVLAAADYELGYWLLVDSNPVERHRIDVVLDNGTRYYWESYTLHSETWIFGLVALAILLCLIVGRYSFTMGFSGVLLMGYVNYIVLTERSDNMFLCLFVVSVWLLVLFGYAVFERRRRR